MSRPKEGSPLIEAVRAFDDELDRFSRAATAACRRQLDSKRELDRAAESVREAADAELALQTRAREMLEALRAAESAQQSRADALRVRASEIQARFDEYATLAGRYQQLGEEGAVLLASAQKLRAESMTGAAPNAPAELALGLGTLEQQVSALRETARGLAEDARGKGFDDLAGEAHGVEQTLSALRNKLLLAQRAAVRAPGPGDA